MADRLARRVAGQLDCWNLELLKSKPDLLFEAHEKHRCFEIISEVVRIAHFPLHEACRIKHQGNREHAQLILLGGRAEIDVNLATEVGSHHQRLRYRNHGIFTIFERIKALRHIEEVHTINLCTLFCSGFDGLTATQGQIHRGEALLTI
ncbi:hypothetical protein D9M70_491070 [compost metagenome]